MREKNSLTPKKSVKVEKVSELRGITVDPALFTQLSPDLFRTRARVRYNGFSLDTSSVKKPLTSPLCLPKTKNVITSGLQEGKGG
jgi:hypothetical protein